MNLLKFLLALVLVQHLILCVYTMSTKGLEYSSVEKTNTNVANTREKLEKFQILLKHFLFAYDH